MNEFTLRCFLAVAETGSFTRAAQMVNRTQSAITQQMSSLEKSLGKRLFDRGKQIRLTKDGEIFLPYANKIFALHLEVLDRFKHPELEGEIRFGLPEDFAAMFLSDVLTDFSRLHPRILLNVECDLTLNLFDRFKKGAFDMVLVKMSRPEDFPNGVEVWSEPLEWIGKNDYRLSSDKNNPVPLVLSPEPCVYRASALQSLEQNGIRWKIVFISPSYAGVIAAVNAGMGITVLPRTMIPDTLEVIQEDFLPSLPDIHVSLLKQTDKNECLQSLEDFLLKKLAPGM
ncbi:LysR substrate-binding domain-containing protein [Criblamydia sequanensis]|uniref:Transcriptional regulator n=1 Tax=Candidatus Criblamydia sequanensis CRIB-18 TaxID=1437425 RepID=A0A090E2E0_9BACT|nr:LysR substrate-binding domain-containing protein [Criblamydia sequanensis]CDR34819.1 Transcriptional regulator [Criblamydia sequanensis CRIB-18]